MFSILWVFFLAGLFRLFSSLMSCSQVSQRTGFISAFVEETIKSGPETSQFILQFMPINMVGIIHQP